MSSNSSIVSLRQPDTIDDPLTAVLRSGARRLLAQAIEAEANAFLVEIRGLRLPDGRERVIRHGRGPKHLIQTGIGPVAIDQVKLRDRGAGEAGAERIRFTSAISSRWPGLAAAWMHCCHALFARGLDERLSEAACGLARPRRSKPIASGHCAVAQRVRGGIRATRSLGPAPRRRLGRWRLSPGAHGDAGRMPDDKGGAGTCWC